MDSRKRQTSTVTPAQPGDFPLWFNTYRDLEAGKPSASLGNFATALWLLSQLESLHAVAPVPASLADGRRAKRGAGIGTAIAHQELDF